MYETTIHIVDPVRAIRSATALERAGHKVSLIEVNGAMHETNPFATALVVHSVDELTTDIINSIIPAPMAGGTVMAFRTEAFNDYSRALDLMKWLGCEIVEMNLLKDPVNPSWSMVSFVIMPPAGCTLTIVKSDMATFIYNNGRFTDLHRCCDTLTLGKEINENWT